MAELIGPGLLLETGVPGFGHNAVFEGVRDRLDQRLSAEATARGAEKLRFPPVLPRRQLESSGYLSSFRISPGAFTRLRATNRRRRCWASAPAATRTGASSRR